MIGAEFLSIVGMPETCGARSLIGYSGIEYLVQLFRKCGDRGRILGDDLLLDRVGNCAVLFLYFRCPKTMSDIVLGL